MNHYKESLKIFRNDLCKDQREIEILSYSSNKLIRKYNTSLDEFESEYKVLDYLLRKNINVPRIFGKGYRIENDGNKVPYVDIEYFDGIRVYNIFAYLREIKQTNNIIEKQVNEIKEKLFIKCKQNQIAIQKELINFSKVYGEKKVYSQKKIYELVYMLCEIIKISPHKNLFDFEIPYILNEFNKIANVPFRDSTTKNMLLYYPKLYLGNYIEAGQDILFADEKRKKYFVNMIKNGEYEEMLESPIVDFDFSSCKDLTSIYDDPIGFLCHEINWTGIPNVSELIWNNKNDIINNVEIAVSFIIRFLRFGGRKLVYHFFHPNAYKYRFRYDNENFYFEKLPEIIMHYWKESKQIIPHFLNFVEAVIIFNKYHIYNDIDIFELEYPNCNRKFYIDIYPY